MSFQLEEISWMQRDFGLDRRLIKALSKLSIVYPTLVQAKTIPLALAGKDVLVRAKTGSGKTIAFALPILQKLLSTPSTPDAARNIKCLILAPTKELCKQIEKNMTDLIYYCKDNISLCSLSDDNMVVQQFRLQNQPDIVISTPARIVHHLKSKAIDLSATQLLVIDEADLILSFGYAEDVQLIMTKLPKIVQGLLMSATLSPELDKFKKIVLNNPAILKLEETKGVGHLLQFYLEVSESDKFLVLYVFLKLGLLQGKGLIFVNDVNKCYRLKLFLLQFFVNSAVLNAQVPANSRIHIIEDFNRGAYDYLIATDASVDKGEEDEVNDEDEEVEDEGEQGGDDTPGDDAEDDDEEMDGEGEEEEDVQVEEGDEEDDGDEEEEDPEEEAEDPEAEAEERPRKKSVRGRASRADEDYGVSRGIDFNGVGFVINFDFPVTAAAYTHRVGRTARGGANGTSLSFVTRLDGARGKELDQARTDHQVLSQVRLQQPRLAASEGDSILGAMAGGEDEDGDSRMQPSPLQFNLKELDAFKYRVEDTLKSVTSVAVKEFRTAEIKREILNSAKLRSFFANNPNDLKALRHDKAVLHPIRQKDHLKTVPDYLIPASMRSLVNIKGKRGKKRSHVSARGRGSQDQRVQRSKMNDPLLNPPPETAHEGEGGGDEAETPRVFSEREVLGKGTSGRNIWKMKHQKGKFNPKLKRPTNRVAGSFTKAKKPKF